MNREERRAAAREGILAAAHRQVADGGCASASVVAVAARAGVATGTIYRHFGSRAELVATVVGDALGAEQRLLAAAASGGPPQALDAWVATSVDRLLGAPVLADALLLEPVEPRVHAARAAALAEQERHLAGLLAAGGETGAWPPADHARQAAAIRGALQAALVGAAARDRVGPRPDVAAEQAELTRLVRGAVGAAPGGA